MRVVVVCRREMSNFLSCLMQQSADHWECDPEGTAAIKDEYCNEEQAVFVACLAAAEGAPP
jgi:hypothetical protein